MRHPGILLRSYASTARLLLLTLVALVLPLRLVRAEDTTAASTRNFATISPAKRSARHVLREFDRYLDHHPLQIAEVRRNPALLRDRTYLLRNPELAQFLQQTPALIEALKTHPHHLLHRALMWQANAPLHEHEVAVMDRFLEAHHAIKRDLIDDPELIRNAAYLNSHTDLRGFIAADPVLLEVFRPVPGVSGGQ